jgi:Tol biopolymer transport system component
VIVGPEQGAESGAFQLATRCVGHPRRECRELAPRSIEDAKKRGHCLHVSVVLRALPLVGTAGFGTDEGLRRPSALGCVCHIQTVALDLLVQMPPPILAQAKAMRSLDRIEHERLQRPGLAFSRQDALWGGRQGNEPGTDFGVNLYVMDVAGTNVRPLSKPGSGWEIQPGSAFGQVSGSPAWSADGRALYYHRVGKEGADIRRVALDGSDDALIARSGMSPSLRPDGRVAFSRPQPRPGLDEFDTLLRTGAIVSIASDGGDLRQESDTARSYFAPAFDHRSGRMVAHGPGAVEDRVTIGDGAAFAPPDAHRQAVLPDRSIEVRGIRGYFPALTHAGAVLSSPLHLGGGDRPLPLQMSAIDGTGMRALFTPPSGVAWGAAVARDAKLIVVAAGPPFAPREARVDIWRLRLDGTGAVNLTADARGNNALPHISAAGQRIVFRSGGDGSGHVFMMDGDGKHRRRLTDAAAVETMPALSPDGDWVVFPTDRAGGRKLWIQRVDGTAGRFLEPDRLDIPDLSLHPRFSPDGKWVVFTSNRAGFNDEWPLTWFPQPYGELFGVPVTGGPTVRLTHDKWEDGPSDWGYVHLAGRQ